MTDAMTTKAPDLSPESVERLAAHYVRYPRIGGDLIASTLRALAARADALTNGGICEVAAVNPSVMDYMRHWENRAEKAEEQVDALTKERDEARAEWSRLLKRANENYGRATKAEVAVDALTKERGTLVQAAKDAGTSFRFAIGERDAALARLGAVERETLDRAAEAIEFLLPENGAGEPQDRADRLIDATRRSSATAIRVLPLNPDAAAALDRAIASAVQDERRACAEVAMGHAGNWEDAEGDAGAVISAAILARGAKQEDGE